MPAAVHSRFVRGDEVPTSIAFPSDSQVHHSKLRPFLPPEINNSLKEKSLDAEMAPIPIEIENDFRRHILGMRSLDPWQTAPIPRFRVYHAQRVMLRMEPDRLDD
jgi:hypothetical protein